MAPESGSAVSVLIIDTDSGIRGLVAIVLEQAGFHTVGVDDLQSAATALNTLTFAAVVRDLNLAPSESRRSLKRLAATSPELLRRTVVMTTAAARAEKAIAAGTVFAIVGKPFDIANLVTAVRACALGACDADRWAAGTPALPHPRQGESETGPSVKLSSVERFVTTVPSLQRMLAEPVASEREAVLRAEMRRTLGTLSSTLLDAAHVEASRIRAAVFRAASTVASQLAMTSSRTPAVRGNDH